MRSLYCTFVLIILALSMNYSNVFSQETELTDAQINEFLEVHNLYREEVKSAPLVWSNELASFARAWAEQLAQTGCNMEHRPAGGEWSQIYGENIYWSSGFAPSPKDIVDSWGSEKKDYDGGEMNEKNFAAGHYTQIIWSQTTQVGCAIIQCSDGSYIAVCNYNPAGNYMGQSPLNK